MKKQDINKSLNGVRKNIHFMTKVQAKNVIISAKLNKRNQRRQKMREYEASRAIVKNKDLEAPQPLSTHDDSDDSQVNYEELNHDEQFLDTENDVRNLRHPQDNGDLQRNSQNEPIVKHLKNFDKAYAEAKVKRKVRLQKEIEKAKLHVPEPRASLLGAGFHESYDEPY